MPRRHATLTAALANMGENLAGPGMDTREWMSMARVEDIAVRADGVFVDILLLPSQQEETAHLGSDYGGDGYGDHCPLEVGELVIVGCPEGNFDAGITILKMIHCSSAKPSATALANPQDRIIHAKDGQNIRLVVTGAGNVSIDPQGTGKVKIGDAATEPMILGMTLTQHLQTLYTALASHVHTGGTIMGSTGPSAALVTSITTLSAQLQALLATKGVVK